jgi:DNA polymerase-3 subunit gamma/tau
MTSSTNQPYRVLARKYRPATFEQMIGQDAVVQTLTNAINLGRLAHAFILTGVRGIGKTSTARILAKGLNCEGADGSGGPTMSPCGVCGPCKDINDGRHIDVLEMDAASNTGVDDVRDIIDGVAYRPVSARFKIYIIDEVHMLSRNAFNALLKTLEEPPDNVKFVFATTEIRKVPVTILSRCQRFDLRRVPVDLMTQHLQAIADSEQINVAANALVHIAKASEGAVRDALSLLDQAAAMSADEISEQVVLDMLGQANADLILGMLRACLDGQTVAALELFTTADGGGAEPDVLIADLLDKVHLATLMAGGAGPSDQPESQQQILEEIAASGIARLGRAWQVLLTGHREIKEAPNPKTAAQMVLIRLAHIAPMPTPAEIIKSLPNAPTDIPTAQAPPATAHPAIPSAEVELTQDGQPQIQPSDSPPPAFNQPSDPVDETTNLEEMIFSNMHGIAASLDEAGEKILAARLRRNLRPVSLATGKLEVQIEGNDVSDNLLGELARFMSQKSGQPWLVSRALEGGGPTLAELERQIDEQKKTAAAGHPVVLAILDKFDGAEISAVQPHKAENEMQSNEGVKNA